MHYHFDNDEFCEDCLPGRGEPDYGEQDYPAHCCRCLKPLDCNLTPDGVQYVLERLREPLDATEYSSYDGTWYAGMPHYSIRRDWAQTLLDYSLSASDRKIVDDFLEATCGQTRNLLTVPTKR